MVTCALNFLSILQSCVSPIGPKDQSDETIAKIEQLEERYDTLVVRVESLVKQKAKSVSEFRRKLTLLPSRMVNREELEQNLEKHLSVIYHADSIEEIFGLLNLRVWNYLNYHLLQYIAQVYGDVETNRMMEDYIATVEEFKSSTTLHMFLSVQSKRKCPEVPATLRRELEQVMFTHHKLSLESTLTEVECFRRDLAQHFSLPEFTTIIVEIEPGSVTTVWLMTLSAATVLQERIEEGDLNFLRAHEITKLRVDGKTVYSAGVLIFQFFLFSLVRDIYRCRKIPVYFKKGNGKLISLPVKFCPNLW